MVLKLTKAEYEKRFEEDKPLLQYNKNSYPERMHIFYIKAGRVNEGDYIQLHYGEKLSGSYETFVYETQAMEAELMTYDFLSEYCGGPEPIVHQRVVDILEEMCPDDIQVFDAVIKNTKSPAESYENHDFKAINITHRIEVLDLEQSEYKIDEDDYFWLRYRVFKDASCMGDHLIVRDEHTGSVIYHPKLAKRLKDCKRIQFFKDEDARF